MARRARALPREYASKAREVDRKYCGAASGERGPVAQKLQSFEEVRGLVFGAWGEASPEAERLLTILARSGGTHL